MKVTETGKAKVRAAMMRHLFIGKPRGAFAVNLDRAVDDVVKAVEADSLSVSDAVGGTHD
jgi:hypothetical protein